MDRPDDRVSTALVALALLPFPEHSLQSVLRHTAELARDLFGTPPAASLTVLQSGRATTVAATDEVAEDLDEVQYRSRSGPCLAAGVTGRVVGVPDVRTDRRWPELAGAAAARSCRGVLSVPAPGRTPVAGSLNLYLPDGSDRGRDQALARFCVLAAVPLWNRYCHDSAVRHAENLETALATRAVIDQAKGIVMERFRLPADQAFDVLVRISNDTNTKLREVATRVTHTGEIPGR
ncbi:GAF and ANTAR domain-containing protein [Geodermatophilus sp. SYSU D00697]